MKTGLLVVLGIVAILSGLVAGLGNILWIGYAIYLIVGGATFWGAVSTCLVGWLVTMVVAVVLWVVAAVTMKSLS